MAGQPKSRPKSQALLDAAANPLGVGAAFLETLAASATSEEIMATVKGLLGATVIQRLGGDTYEERPDWRAREAGLKILAGYLVGLPVARSIEVHQQAPVDDSASLERLLSSPAVRAALLRELGAPAEVRPPGGKAGGKAPIDADSAT